ncbi:acyl-CoA thioesterase, partial [Pseudomonas aeruginosa]
LELETAEQKCRFAQAQQRRQLRAELEARYQAIREDG